MASPRKNDVYTRQEAAAELKVGVRTVDRMRADGTLKWTYVARRRVVIRGASIRKALAKRPKPPPMATLAALTALVLALYLGAVGACCLGFEAADDALAPFGGCPIVGQVPTQVRSVGGGTASPLPSSAGRASRARYPT